MINRTITYKERGIMVDHWQATCRILY